jgi:electron transfer flavoprotein beta subunit
MSAEGLAVVVLVATVHDCLNPVTIEPGGKRIAASSIRRVLNPFDAFALEEALCFRDRVPGTRICAMTMAPRDSEGVLRECLAAGADEVVRLWDDRMEGSDAYATASVLAAALGKRSFDLVLCGWRRSDLECGQVGPALAELLGIPQVTGTRGILPGEDPRRIHLAKRVPGYLTRVACPLPAVVTVEKGPVLRYPRHMDRLRARKAEIPAWDLEAIGLSEDRAGRAGSINELERFTPPKPTRRSAMAAAGGMMTAAARLQRIMDGGVRQRRESKIWECPDPESVEKVVEHMVKEKRILL